VGGAAPGLGVRVAPPGGPGRAAGGPARPAAPPRVHRLLLATRLDRVLTLDAADVA
jgi:hypothetical protein